MGRTCKYRGCDRTGSTRIELELFKWDEIDEQAEGYNPKAVELCNKHWARWLEFWEGPKNA